jgi:hypothetical protein
MAGGSWWPWLDAIGFGRSGPQRPGVDGAGGVLRASDGCRGELVGVSPIFIVDNAVPAPPWWWGCGVVHVLVDGSEMGLPDVSGPSGRDVAEERGACYFHGWERATAMAGSV